MSGCCPTCFGAGGSSLGEPCSDCLASGHPHDDDSPCLPIPLTASGVDCPAPEWLAERTPEATAYLSIANPGYDNPAELAGHLVDVENTLYRVLGVETFRTNLPYLHGAYFGLVVGTP